MKEKINDELSNERIWLQSYVQKLESKVNELEKSNAILRKKCDSMSQSENTNCQCQTRVNNSENILSNSTELIVNNLQQKVSNFILQQIDCQVDRMISVNLDNNIPNLATSDSSKVHALRSDLNNDTQKTSCTQSTESRYPTPEINYSRSEQSHTQSNAPSNNHMGQQHSRSNREQQNTLRMERHCNNIPKQIHRNDSSLHIAMAPSYPTT